MHDPASIAGLKQVSDGVITLELVREGTQVDNFLSVEKMAGLLPSSKSYKFSIVMPESQNALA
jgi:KaiC/GvpD/RAD55 family RecA-like ATPase